MNTRTTSTAAPGSAASDTGRTPDGRAEPPSTAFGRSVGWVAAHALLVVLILFLVVFAVLSPTFGSLSNGEVILLTASAPALLAIGQTFVILTGGIDLSVGSVVGLSGVVAAQAAQGPHADAAVAVLAGTAAGAAVGAVNGLLVIARIPRSSPPWAP
jgi:ribose/xylose/arabinose/galactoside ABC-type transport system permease subunit